MKQLIMLLICGLLLTGCVWTTTPPEGSLPTKPTEVQPTTVPTESTTEPPTDFTAVTFTLYYGNENVDGFYTKEVTIPELNVDLVMEQLIEANVLAKDVILLSHNIINNTCLHLDFNEAFLNQIHTMGTSGEWLMMGSVVNTFLNIFNPTPDNLSVDIDRVYITVNGEIIESGHQIYDFEMGFFE